MHDYIIQFTWLNCNEEFKFQNKSVYIIKYIRCLVHSSFQCGKVKTSFYDKLVYSIYDLVRVLVHSWKFQIQVGKTLRFITSSTYS